MVKKVWRTGNSLVVSITKEEAERLDIHEGDFVDVQLQKMELPGNAARSEGRAGAGDGPVGARSGVPEG